MVNGAVDRQPAERLQLAVAIVRTPTRLMARLPERDYRITPSASRPCLTQPRAGRSAIATGAAVAAAVTLGIWLSACGGETKTVTQPASTAPLGRPIGGQSRHGAAGETDARAAARAFLTSYLAISYGHAKPDELRGASRALRDRLRAQNPRVPPGVRNRRPRVIALHVKAVSDGRVRATATVDDGDVAPYPLFATLAKRSSGRWIAVSVGG